MGLSVALSNALSGMKVNQSSLDVVSRNVANAGTPGYHRQSVGLADQVGINSSSVALTGVQRAFNQSLQTYYTNSVSDASAADTRASFLDQLQAYLGKVGAAGSLDTTYNSFTQSLQTLATSPDSAAARADVVSKAQTLATRLNQLSGQVQSLRRETESQMSTAVGNLNTALTSLEKVNNQIVQFSGDDTSRAALMDQRDRLVSQVAELVDVRVDYHDNGTVALTTRGGIGLIDAKASQLSFAAAGQISATGDAVGKLVIRTPGGLSLDVVQQGGLQGGQLGALVELRDTTLVSAQNQLDEVAAALAQALSTVETAGAAATGGGGATGFEVDLAAVRPGNEIVLNYTENGQAKSLRAVRVDDPSKLPMDYLDGDGNRVVGVDFSGGPAAVAAALQTALGPNLAVTNPSGGLLRVVDDGAGGITDISGLKTRTTVSGTQGAGLGLSLFVDSANADFTNDLGGIGQKRGFAARISVNSAVLSDNRLLVQYDAGNSLGDSARVDALNAQLDALRFSANGSVATASGSFRLNGTVGDLVSQLVNFQGTQAANALSNSEGQALVLEGLNTRMSDEYGVSVDEEMARLMELQNAYAANARVIATVQDLLQSLMEAV